MVCMLDFRSTYAVDMKNSGTRRITPLLAHGAKLSLVLGGTLHLALSESAWRGRNEARSITSLALGDENK